jgi:uncharacterized protein YndB with AHSA1/START domain
MDIAAQIAATARETSARGSARLVTLRRRYPVAPEELWAACTRADRLSGWLGEVRGELRQGGRYELVGRGTSGSVLECVDGVAVRLTWEFGGDSSSVVLRFAGEGASSSLTLEHEVGEDDHWREYGPAATGVGWEGSLVALDLHLRDDPAASPEAMLEFGATDAGHDLVRRSSAGWAAASIAAGDDPDWAREAAVRTAAFYTGG